MRQVLPKLFFMFLFPARSALSLHRQPERSFCNANSIMSLSMNPFHGSTLLCGTQCPLNEPTFWTRSISFFPALYSISVLRAIMSCHSLGSCDVTVPSTQNPVLLIPHLRSRNENVTSCCKHLPFSQRQFHLRPQINYLEHAAEGYVLICPPYPPQHRSLRTRIRSYLSQWSLPPTV